MKRILPIVIIVLLVIVGFLFFVKRPPSGPMSGKVVEEQNIPLLEQGRQCYTYSHTATTDEPYTVSEFIDITVDGANVTGTKQGTQSGPDMTNGYTGTLSGILEGDTITALFSYTIEGSKNTEKELYKVLADKIGLEKLRYPLKEEGKMLVPDTTKEFKVQLYARVGCTASN